MTSRWSLPSLGLGDMVPAFTTASRTNPTFHFSSVAGRHLLLAIMPRDRTALDAAVAAVEPLMPRFEGHFLAAFFVAREPVGDSVPPDRPHGQRWLFDPPNQVAATLGLGADESAWLLLDPAMRLVARAPIDQPGAVFDRIVTGLPALQAYAGVEMVAPVMIVPRVFDPAFCRQLIDIYETRGGERSGVMRDVDGRTIGVLGDMKSRRDVNLQGDTALRAEIVAQLLRTIAPMMRRTFQFNPTRLERHIVACYAADEGGFFSPHRDDESLGTAHRRFACSINLNAEEHEGGDLRFPEFGPQTYRPPTGGAVIFHCNLLHEARPVTRGRRYAFLPFLYDEAGQRLREQNLALLEARAAEAAATR